jgi:hypothetical protein
MRPVDLGLTMKGQRGGLYELAVPKNNPMRELNDFVRQVTSLGIVEAGPSFVDIEGARKGQGYMGSW